MSGAAERAFLPAAIEIQETPPSPAGRATLWAILACFVLAVLWASSGEVDIVAVAQGHIIPSGHSKPVQSLDIGRVSAIHVSEGQTISAGEILLELDAISKTADVTRLENELRAVQRDIDRYSQLGAWAENDQPPSTGDLLVEEDQLLYSEWRKFEDRLDVLERERNRQNAERRSAERQVNKLNAILPIVSRRATDRKGLAEKKLLPEQQYLEAEQARLEVFHDLRVYNGRVGELAAAFSELEARIEYTHSEFHHQMRERLEEAVRRQTATEQELAKARANAKAQTIRAPVDGVVQQLAVRSIGAVVTAAQQLMLIVPRGGSIEIEAILENKDIGFVEVGQQTAIKIDTFPFTKYGTIAGRIVDLSDDAVLDERRGLVYKMRVVMDRTEIQVNGKQVRLSPGMSVTVESKTGSRRLIEFFLSPLLRVGNESVRER